MNRTMNSATFQEREAIGESEAFLDFQEKISRAAKVDRPVLLIGERGTGKEMAASRLHFLSSRWTAPFVTLNCAALPPDLIEAELFGHTAGAFTGASKMRKGRFEEADGGTLFLDELGLIPVSVQEKILRVVEYGSFERVGSSETVEVDVRIVGATNQDLPELCRQGRFKRDLLDRLSFEVLFLPPLRARGHDILLLANLFAARMASEVNMKQPYFTGEVKQNLLTYEWPGNIRELKNTVERAVYKCETGIITKLEFDPFLNPWKKEFEEKESVNSKNELPVEVERQPNTEEYDLSDFRQHIRDVEKEYISIALKKSGGNQKSAAALLDISYDSFRGLYRKYFQGTPE